LNRRDVLSWLRGRIAIQALDERWLDRFAAVRCLGRHRRAARRCRGARCFGTALRRLPAAPSCEERHGLAAADAGLCSGWPVAAGDGGGGRRARDRRDLRRGAARALSGLCRLVDGVVRRTAAWRRSAGWRRVRAEGPSDRWQPHRRARQDLLAAALLLRRRTATDCQLSPTAFAKRAKPGPMCSSGSPGTA
jgi:hypothetical protein